MPVTEYRFGPRLWKTTLPDDVINKLYKKANALRDAGGLTKEELSQGNKEWVANPTLRFDAFGRTCLNITLMGPAPSTRDRKSVV